MIQIFGQRVCRSGFNSSIWPCLWPWKISPFLSTVIHCVMHAFAAYWPQLRRFWLGDYACLQRDAPTTLDVWAGHTILLVKKALSSALLLIEFQILCPMSCTHWGYSSFWNGRRTWGSFQFCMWKEKMIGYDALVWSMSTWLAHGMPEATFDFFTLWTMKLSSLSRIF